MFRNYLAAALRNLVRNRLYAAINIVGLAVGLAAALLIALFVRNEFSYDRWLPNADRTYLLGFQVTFPGRAPIYGDGTPVELANLLKLEFPSIEAVARLSGESTSVRHGEIENYDSFFWADPNFFEVIKVPVVAGNLQDALREPDGIVLSKSMARKYFGRDDPIGETLEIGRQHPMRIMAVIENLPSNTHLELGIVASGLASFSRLAHLDSQQLSDDGFLADGLTYLRLAPNASETDLRENLLGFLQRHKSKTLQTSPYRLTLVPISGVHLSKGTPGFIVKPRGQVKTIYAVTAIGIVIVLIASINFVNLATARATRRAIEVGVRKMTGAKRSNLIVQFIGEAMIFAFLAMIFSIGLVFLLLPSFNAFLDRSIPFKPWHDPAVAAGLIGAASIVGALAGAYPAFVISAFTPVIALKGRVAGGAGSELARQVLVVLQFAVLIGLIVGTGIVYRQTSFAFNEGMRISTDQVLAVGVDDHCRGPFKEEVRKLPGVREVVCSTGAAFGFGGFTGSVTTADGTEIETVRTAIDFGFFEFYGLKPVAGRFFERQHPGDTLSDDPKAPMGGAIVINQAAVRKLGYASASEAIGRTTTLKGIRTQTLPSEIIGVVPDFSLDAVHEQIGPAVYYVDPNQSTTLSIRLIGLAIPETMKEIEKLWTRIGDPHPIDWGFINKRVQFYYADLIRQSRVFLAFSEIALFVACLGLFGVAASTAERRTKEIGIRKAMGAGRGDILRLLIWQFTKPVLWANVIAWPAGYLVMRRWLEGFAYHIDLEPWVFLAASGLAVVIAVFTVSGHALLVSGAQPVSALRYE